MKSHQQQQRSREQQGFGPANWQRSDEFIKDDACRRLYNDPNIDARGLTVEVSGGTISLSGTVQSPREKMLAQQLLTNIPGAKGLHTSHQIAQQTQQEYAQSTTGGTRGGRAT